MLPYNFDIASKAHNILYNLFFYPVCLYILTNKACAIKCYLADNITKFVDNLDFVGSIDTGII